MHPTTELTLVCINSIETLESVTFFTECLFFCLRLLLKHEVHLVHYIQCLSRFHVVTFHSVCRINFDEILFICFLKSRIGKRTTITIMEFPSQISPKYFCSFRTSFYTDMVVLTVIHRNLNCQFKVRNLLIGKIGVTRHQNIQVHTYILITLWPIKIEVF